MRSRDASRFGARRSSRRGDRLDQVLVDTAACLRADRSQPSSPSTLRAAGSWQPRSVATRAHSGTRRGSTQGSCARATRGGARAARSAASGSTAVPQTTRRSSSPSALTRSSHDVAVDEPVDDGEPRASLAPRERRVCLVLEAELRGRCLCELAVDRPRCEQHDAPRPRRTSTGDVEDAEAATTLPADVSVMPPGSSPATTLLEPRRREGLEGLAAALDRDPAATHLVRDAAVVPEPGKAVEDDVAWIRADLNDRCISRSGFGVAKGGAFGRRSRSGLLGRLPGVADFVPRPPGHRHEVPEALRCENCLRRRRPPSPLGPSRSGRRHRRASSVVVAMPSSVPSEAGMSRPRRSDDLVHLVLDGCSCVGKGPRSKGTADRHRRDLNRA